MAYTTKHKMVLQALMWAKILTKNELIEVFKKLQSESDLVILPKKSQSN